MPGAKKIRTLNYFQHFVNYGQTITIMQSKYGNDGYAFWFKLLELLGKTDDHCIDGNNFEGFEYLISYTMIKDRKTAIEMLDILANIDAIDKDLWVSYKCIRSENFIHNHEHLYAKRLLKPSTIAEITQTFRKKYPSKRKTSRRNTNSKGKLPEEILS